MPVVVTTAATDRSLLTIAELRAAVGVADTSKDAKLLELGRDVAAALARACNLPTFGTAPATFRTQTYTETLYAGRARGAWLQLSAWPIISVTSAVEDAIGLVSADYRIDVDNARLTRLNGIYVYAWSSQEIVVVYRAGWETVPDILKLAAKKMVVSWWSPGAPRDPNLRSVRTDGVGERSFWVGPKDDPAFHQEVMDLLGDFMNVEIG